MIVINDMLSRLNTILLAVPSPLQYWVALISKINSKIYYIQYKNNGFQGVFDWESLSSEIWTWELIPVMQFYMYYYVFYVKSWCTRVHPLTHWHSSLFTCRIPRGPPQLCAFDFVAVGFASPGAARIPVVQIWTHDIRGYFYIIFLSIQDWAPILSGSIFCWLRVLLNKHIIYCNILSERAGETGRASTWQHQVWARAWWRRAQKNIPVKEPCTPQVSINPLWQLVFCGLVILHLVLCLQVGIQLVRAISTFVH